MPADLSDDRVGEAPWASAPVDLVSHISPRVHDDRRCGRHTMTITIYLALYLADQPVSAWDWIKCHGP